MTSLAVPATLEAASAPKAVAPPSFGPRIILGLVGVLLAVLVSGLNEMVTKVALADIRGGMAIGYDEGTWLVASYAATSVAAMAFAPWCSVTFSLRRFTLCAIALFGLSGGMVLAVVAFGAMWPVLLATLHGLANVHKQLREVSRSLELSHLAFVLKIGLPNAMPDILAGMRLSLTVSLIVSVVGEMIASQAGLGQAILLAARSFQASDLFAGIVLLGAMGFASNVLLALAERSLLRWQHP